MTDATGALAGATIVMRDAVAYSVRTLGVPVADALGMATSTPAKLLGLSHEVGTLKIGARADLVHLSDALDLFGVYVKPARDALHFFATAQVWSWMASAAPPAASSAWSASRMKPGLPSKSAPTTARV